MCLLFLQTFENCKLISIWDSICVQFQLPVSPGEYSHSDGSNHAMSLGMTMSHYRSGHDTLPISDNNVSTTNDALEAGDWDVPENEADLDVSIDDTDTNVHVNILLDWILSQICHQLSITIYTKTKSVEQMTMIIVDTKHRLDSDCHVPCEGNMPTMSHLFTLIGWLTQRHGGKTHIISTFECLNQHKKPKTSLPVGG